MALLSTVYCSIAEVKRFMSANYAIQAADNDRDDAADTDVIEDAINFASEEIDFYARQRYVQAGLLTSNLINRWAVLFAACNLAMVRGNPIPAIWEQRREEILEHLMNIAKGIAQIPGLALREDMRPSMSNLTIDRRYRRSKIRVSPSNSTDAPTKLTQDKTIDYGNSWE